MYHNNVLNRSTQSFEMAVKIVSVSTTSTWSPPVAAGSTPVSQASSSPSSPGSEDQSGSPHANTNATMEHCSTNSLGTDIAGALQCHGDSEQSGSGSDCVASSFSPQFSIGCEGSERMDVVFDNLTLQKW